MDRVEIAIELAKRVYFEHAAGGSLHICLDDGNLDDEFFRSCLYDDFPELSWAEQECGEYWRRLSDSEREEAYARRQEYADGDAHKASFGSDWEVAR